MPDNAFKKSILNGLPLKNAVNKIIISHKIAKPCAI